MPKVRNVLKIGFDAKGKVRVYGPLDDKKLCMLCLTEAIKIVSDIENTKIKTPKVELVPKPKIILPNR